MPRLETLEMTIETGKRGLDRAPAYAINGHQLDFNEISGGNGSRETMRLVGSPQSFPHSLTLTGPDDGFWDIEKIEASFHVSDGGPYTVRLGAVTLDRETCLNLWYDRPPQLLDV